MKSKGIMLSLGTLVMASPLAMLIGGNAQTVSSTLASTSSYENEEWRQFIFDRTFSLQSISFDETQGGWGACWGTGWIVSDATPEDANDYSYYIATNWHVYDGMESVKQQAIRSNNTHKVQFGCKYDSDNLDPLKDYISFANFEDMPDKDFSLDGETSVTISNGQSDITGLEGIDFHISKGDFSSIVYDNSETAKTAKAKLDRLNLNTKNHKPITEFAPTANDNLHFESKNMYTGGYPVHSTRTIQNSPTWECHDIKSEGFDLKYFNDQEYHEFAHNCDETSYPMIDCSPQYQFVSETTNNFMSGGASGSMLLGDFGDELNHDFKVCGIYWGGWNTYSGFIPHYSIFNSDYKNFVASYI